MHPPCYQYNNLPTPDTRTHTLTPYNAGGICACYNPTNSNMGPPRLCTSPHLHCPAHSRITQGKCAVGIPPGWAAAKECGATNAPCQTKDQTQTRGQRDIHGRGHCSGDVFQRWIVG